MFAQYKQEVNPNVRLFLVSFLKVGEEGTIWTRLRQHGVDPNCMKQFRLHPENPDTSKFQPLLGMIALQLASMKERCHAVEQYLVDGRGFEDNDARRVANVICSYL